MYSKCFIYEFWEEILKAVTIARNCSIFPLYLTVQPSTVIPFHSNTAYDSHVMSF